MALNQMSSSLKFKKKLGKEVNEEAKVQFKSIINL